MEEFKFKVKGFNNDIIFTAKKVGTYYAVTWEENGKETLVLYPDIDVEKYIDNGCWIIVEGLKICKDNLDKKVNAGETLREFIKNSTKEFYEIDLSDTEIDTWSEEKLIEEVEHLDYLWEK